MIGGWSAAKPLAEKLYLEILHEKAEAHRKRYPLRPFRVVGQLAGGSNVFCVGTYATRARAEAVLSDQRGYAPLGHGYQVEASFWIEERT